MEYGMILNTWEHMAVGVSDETAMAFIAEKVGRDCVDTVDVDASVLSEVKEHLRQRAAGTFIVCVHILMCSLAPVP